MEERDPTIDPQAGDLVRTELGAMRFVVSVDCGEIVYEQRSGGKRYLCWISTWREWCRKNKAVNAWK